MFISVINHTDGRLTDKEVQSALRAINRQLAEDFEPYWHIHAQLRLEGKSQGRPDVDSPVDMRGDAVIYLWDEADIDNALGYHARNYMGVPYGFVFIDICDALNENWTVTLSHEALELVGDRNANLLVMGPHPDETQNRTVFHWREMCDAVQSETYLIDGVEVSNFVLPLYFTPENEAGGRNDFLGRRSGEQPLKSFGVKSGSYVGFFDPATGVHDTYQLSAPAGVPDPVERQFNKNLARQARRGSRYSALGPVDAAQVIDVGQESSQLGPGPASPSVRVVTHGLQATLATIERLSTDRVEPLRLAFDPRASEQSIVEQFQEAGLEEIAQPFVISGVSATDAEATAQPDGTRFALQVDVPREDDDERIILMTEVDGIALWHFAQVEPRGGGVVHSCRLHLDAPGAESPALRGSIFSGLGKIVVRFFLGKAKQLLAEIGDNVAEFIADKVERALKEERMLQFNLLESPINGRLAELAPAAPLAENGRYLLFIHGIFSSIEGGFRHILINHHGDDLISVLTKRYDRVIGYDHWTVAKDTLQNARDLISALPRSAHLDIVCHSRGAGVTRCILEHPDLSTEIQAKQLRFGEIVLVAGANQGSPLASPENIAKLLNLVSALSSLPSAGGLALKAVAWLLRLIAIGQRLPGIAAMDPASEIIEATNGPHFTPVAGYTCIRSNYEPEGKIARIADEVGVDRFVFNNQKNDLIVPFDGAATFDPTIDDRVRPIVAHQYDSELNPEDSVMHTTFFKRGMVRRILLEKLNPTESLSASLNVDRAREPTAPRPEPHSSREEPAMPLLSETEHFVSLDRLPVVPGWLPTFNVFATASRHGVGAAIIDHLGRPSFFVELRRLAEIILGDEEVKGVALGDQLPIFKLVTESRVRELLIEIAPALAEVDQQLVRVDADAEPLREQKERVYGVTDQKGHLIGWFLNHENLRGQANTPPPIFYCTNPDGRHENNDPDSGTCYSCPYPIESIS